MFSALFFGLNGGGQVGLPGCSSFPCLALSSGFSTGGLVSVLVGMLESDLLLAEFSACLFFLTSSSVIWGEERDFREVEGKEFSEFEVLL